MNCNVCSGNTRFAFYSEDYRYGVKGRFSFYECKECGTLSLDIKKKVEEYPNKEYYSYTQSNKVSKRGLFFYNLFYSEPSLLSLALFFLRPFTRGTVIRKGNKFLDVGCGSGMFLAKMKKLGLEVYGIEPGTIPKQAIKSYNIQNVETQKSKFKEGFFDIITMNHVIEHSKTPFSDIKKLRTYLKNGGTFIIAAPNTDSIAFKIFGKYWAQVDAPRHKALFGAKILKKMLEEAGFKITRIRYNSMPYQFSSSLKYYLKANGKDAWFLDSGAVKLMLMPFAFLMNLLRIGDQVEIWAKK
ncbi:MAG: class I SAM-dependent methyltransferase [archaeon]